MIGPGGGGARLAAGSPEGGRGKMKEGYLFSGPLLEHREWCVYEFVVSKCFKVIITNKVVLPASSSYLVCYNNMSDL